MSQEYIFYEDQGSSPDATSVRASYAKVLACKFCAKYHRERGSTTAMANIITVVVVWSLKNGISSPQKRFYQFSIHTPSKYQLFLRQN
eukprot:snap_masked-scaffold_10-processed-gene-13.7-mRNA-1 protein AED:1.00 eAED:1.00 QI:0/-1/0/0/-1/1/1/0/87